MHKVFGALIVGLLMGFTGWCFDGKLAWFAVATVASLMVVGLNELNERSIRRHQSMIDMELRRREWGWDDES